MNYFKTILFILCLLAVLFISFVHTLIHPELSLSIFYLFPISIVAWFIGMWAGILLSLISAVGWLISDILFISSSTVSLIPYYNESFRFIVFLFIVFIISKLHLLYETQKELSVTDQLTGIINRRGFIILANTELERSRRFSKPLSILYIDLDNFKVVNDNFGHDVGDKLLYQVVKTIKNNIRSFDIFSRLGGDEFIILLPETGAKSARSVADKLKKVVFEKMKYYNWPVTISVGLAIYNKSPDTVEELIKVSDQLMYFAKQDGKNSVKSEVFG